MRILFATLLTLILTAGTAHATPLHDAARDGDIDKVQMLLSSGADPNATADYEEMGELTALHHAAAKGHTDTVSVLLQAGADPNATADNEEMGELTALHLAAVFGHTDTISVLLQAGADLNAPAGGEEIGELTALHLAAEADHPDTVTVLLQAGADRHARDDKDRTPLNIAVTRGHTGTIRALLEGTDNEPTISFNFKHPLVTVSIKGVQRSDLYDEETKVMLKRAAELTAWSAKQLQSQVKKR